MDVNMREELQQLLDSYIAENTEREHGSGYLCEREWERQDAKYDQLREVIIDIQRILNK